MFGKSLYFKGTGKYGKRLLLNPKISVCEIASRCGYENMSNFSAMFKREVGISPNEYRKTVGWKDLIFEDQVFLYKNHK